MFRPESQGHEGVAIIVVVHDELATLADCCQDYHSEGGDGWGSLHGNKVKINTKITFIIIIIITIIIIYYYCCYY